MSFDIPIADQMRIALNYVKFKTNQKRLRSAEKVIADTVYGKVKGVKWRTVYGESYYSFEGIPFAKPPIGPLRFRAPVEPEPWTEIKRCTRIRAKPVQMNIIMKQVQGREDCLYLNVYTKNMEPKKGLPVLVWIYGGGFQMGEASRDLYSPDYFMMEQVVLVTISYRLGPLGFLSLDDQALDVPGNAGLKDQVLALRWVKRNCHFFGGDPDNITIFGESAGGSSVHYMMLTEQAKDLFHKAVIMSGSAIAPWANIPQHNWAYRLAKATGYKGTHHDGHVLEHLRNCKASSMFKVTEDLLTLEERHQRLMFSFGPTIEPYASPHCLIPKPPIEMMRNCWGNRIPMLIGGNSFEGLLMFTEARKYPELLTKLNCENLTPTDAGLSDEQRRHFGNKLKEIYFGKEEPSWKTILNYSDVFSYKYFWHPIHRTALSRLHHAAAPTYLYRFDFDSKHFNFMRIITCGRKVRGTCHADDLSYIFYNAAAKKLKARSAEFKTIRRLISILVCFARCGDPALKVASASGSASAASNNDLGEVIVTCAAMDRRIEEIARVKASNGDHEDYDDNEDEDGGVGLEEEEPTSLEEDERHAADPSSLASDEQLSDSTDDRLSLSLDEQQQQQQQQQEQLQLQLQQQPTATNGDALELALHEPNGATQVEQPHWLPISLADETFKCLNISDELEVIELPEADKLRFWDSMYQSPALLY